MPGKPVTIHDIARAAGVSPAAVSLALRGEGTLSGLTRARIQEMARKMNYRRNVFAASLRTRDLSASGQGMPLAVLVQKEPSGATYPIQTALEGLKSECARLGYALEVIRLDVGAALRPLLRTLYHRGVQGLFLPHTLNAAAASPEDWARFSLVALNRGAVAPTFHTVRASAFDVVLRAVEIIHQGGYRRIGGALFRHDPPILDDIGREAAFAWAMQHCGGTLLPPHLGLHDDREAFLAWVRRSKPDVILGFHVGCYFWLRESAPALARRTGFCSLHLEDHPDVRPLSGFFTPDVEIGRAAVVLMDSLIRHHERGIPGEVRETLLQRPWRPGQTLPPRRPVRTASVSRTR